jgi:selT/selW/selH-like putative selenoprotein
MIRDNKMYAGICLFLGGNMLSNMVSNTGAFEVYYKDRLIFSKLQSGRVPSIDEIIREI